MDDATWNNKNNPMMSQGSSLEGQTLVSLNEVKQGTDDYEDSLLVQSSEEVIGLESDVNLSHQVGQGDMTVPLPDNGSDANITSGKKRKSAKGSKKSINEKFKTC